MAASMGEYNMDTLIILVTIVVAIVTAKKANELTCFANCLTNHDTGKKLLADQCDGDELIAVILVQ